MDIDWNDFEWPDEEDVLGIDGELSDTAREYIQARAKHRAKTIMDAKLILGRIKKKTPDAMMTEPYRYYVAILEKVLKEQSDWDVSS